MLILVSNMSDAMRRIRGGLQRLAGLFGKERDLADELESHLALQIEDNVRSGMSPEQARREAVLKLGGMAQAKELYRDRRSIPVLETTLQDLKFSLRTLGKSPGFTCIAVITLALGMAANTTIFSLVSSVLLRKPPVPDPDRLMAISTINTAEPGSFLDSSAPDFLAWREQARSLEEVAASANRDVTLSGGTEPQRVFTLGVTANYFRVLGVQPTLGRTFLPNEAEHGHDHVAVLSHKLWQSRFNADAAIAGKDVSIDGERYTIIAVMPARFRLDAFDAALWTPLAIESSSTLSLNVVARLRRGISVQEAQAEMSTIAQRSARSHPETNKNRSARVLTMQEFTIQNANDRPAMLLLMSAVAFVLLIACTNIANIVMARNATRQRELLIRAAVGAGRGRLIRQMLVESLLIGAAGGGIGFLLAIWGTALLRSSLTWNDYVQLMASEVVLDWRVFLFCSLISLAAAMFFGLLPAIQASKISPSSGMAEGARGGSAGVERRRLRRALVVAEIALSIVLLTGAGVMIQAVMMESRNPLGFNPHHVLLADVRVSGARYAEPAAQAAFFEKVLQSIAKIPGVEASSGANALPTTGSVGLVNFRVEGTAAQPKDVQFKTRHYVAGPGYFQLMGIPRLQGRGFLASDSGNAPLVVVVNQTFAQRFFPKQDPIGQRILVDPDQPGSKAWSEIVGVVGPVLDFVGQMKPEPQLYQSFLQVPRPGMQLLARMKADPATVAPLIRQSIWSVDRDQPVGAIHSMNQVVDDAGMGDRLMGWLMGIFAGLALVLAGVGIFGVIAYNVSQRTREVGIRMALGAGKSAVVRLVVGQSALLTGLGVGFGMLGAVPLPNLLGSMFNGLPADPKPILVIVPALVALVALTASYVPARRAMRVDPMTALRYE